MPSRIAVIGDLHGEYSALKQILDHLHNTDWFTDVKNPTPPYSSKPSNLLIFTGDYVDRGSQGIKLLDTIIALETTGSAVAIPGNHEFLALGCREQAEIITKNSSSNEIALRDYMVTPHGRNGGIDLVSEFNPDNFRDALDKFAKTFGRAGRYGQWIRNRPPYIIEEVAGKRIAFFHAGVPPDIGDKESLENYNRWYATHIGGNSEDARKKYLFNSLMGEGSPFWIRGEFHSKSKEDLATHLENLALDAVVIGHSRSKDGKIRSFHNLVFDVDIGMCKVYGGQEPGYLMIDKEGIHAHYVGGARDTLREWANDPVVVIQETLSPHIQQSIVDEQEPPTAEPNPPAEEQKLSTGVQDSYDTRVSYATGNRVCLCCGSQISPSNQSCPNCELTQIFKPR